MKLYKNTIILLALIMGINGCGTDEGFKYSVESDAQITKSGAVIVETTEVEPYLLKDDGSQQLDEDNNPIPNPDRYLVVDLLEGVLSNGQPLNQGDLSVFVQQMTRVSEALVSPNKTRVLNLGDQIAIQYSIGTKELIVDRAVFADSGDNLNDNELHTDESITYHYQYWINNGYQFECANMDNHPANCTDEEIAANPNLQTATITINGLDDAIQSLDYSAGEVFELKYGKSANIIDSVKVVPEYARNPGYTWTVPVNDYITIDSTNGSITTLKASVDTSTGLDESVDVTISSKQVGVAPIVVKVKVLPIPVNVGSIEIQDETETAITNLSMYACTLTSVNANALPDDPNQPVSGSLDYEWESQLIDSLTVIKTDSDSALIKTLVDNSALPMDGNSIIVQASLLDTDPLQTADLAVTFKPNLACTNQLNGNFDLVDTIPWVPSNNVARIKQLEIADNLGRGGVGDSAMLLDTNNWGEISILAENVPVELSSDTRDSGKWEISFWLKMLTTPGVNHKLAIGTQGNKPSNANAVLLDASKVNEWQLITLQIDGNNSGTPADIRLANWKATPMKFLFDDFLIRKVE